MNVPSAPLLTWPVCLLLVAMIGMGLWLLRRGWWPRRIGAAPHCAACDYLLVGLDGAERCPECGAVLTGGGIVYGERRRRTWMGLEGLGLVILGAGFLVASGPLGRVQWYHYRPFGWVLKDLDSSAPGVAPRAWAEVTRRASAGEISAAQRTAWIDKMLTGSPAAPAALNQSAWIQLAQMAVAGELSSSQLRAWAGELLGEVSAQSNRSDEAWKELEGFISTGRVGPEVADQLVEVALRMQPASPYSTASERAMTYLGERFITHTLSRAQEKRFVEGMAVVRLEVRPKVGRSDRVPYVLRVTGNGPPAWRSRIAFVGEWVDGRQVNGGGSSISGSIGGASSHGSSVGPQPPGHHTLRARAEISIAASAAALEKGLYLHHVTPEWSAEFDVLPGEAPIDLLNAPDAATMAKYVRAHGFRYDPQNYAPLSGTINVDRAPVDVAFDAVARLPDGREYKLSTVTAAKGQSVQVGIGQRDGPPAAVSQIDVILRGSAAAAKETTNLTQIWDGEIVLKNVPVSQPATRRVN